MSLRRLLHTKALSSEKPLVLNECKLYLNMNMMEMIENLEDIIEVTLVYSEHGILYCPN